MKILPAIIVATVISSIATTCRADFLVFDNAVGGSSGVDSAQVSDSDFPFLHADDFVLSATSFVTSIRWTGAYIFLNSPPVDDFTVQFFADNGTGVPQETPISTYNIGSSVTRQISTSTVFGFDVYDYTADIPGSTLAGGQQYWLSIENNTTGDVDNWFWGSEEDAGNSAGRSALTWASTNHALDFSLYAIPEPSAGVFCLVGLFGLALRRRRPIS